MAVAVLLEGLKYTGIEEIPGIKSNNPLIVEWSQRILQWVRDDEVPWCSSYLNAICQDAGFEHSGKANARSWLDVGTSIPLDKVKIGDIVVLWRSSPNSWKGHVGIYIRHDSNYIWLHGGNQNNAVNISAYPISRILDIRRLKKTKSR
jgi:uncharacterized protein (TIGR02594 family)